MSVDFIDELEALQSVYSDLQIDLLPEDTIETTTTTNRRAQKSSKTSSSKSPEIAQAERIYGIIHLTCTPRSSSTNFVSTDIEISIPALYPAVLPKFKVLKTSGINDDGKEIETLIQKFLDDSPLDECLLFQLICLVFDFLDDCSIGECSICAEAIVPFDFQG
jgi:RWD domain